MRVTRYARDLRPECAMTPNRTLAIDRVASRLRQTGLINPHQQPSLTLLTLPSDRQRASAGQQNARVSSAYSTVVYLDQVSLITFTLNGLQPRLKSLQRATIISGTHFWVKYTDDRTNEVVTCYIRDYLSFR